MLDNQKPAERYIRPKHYNLKYWFGLKKLKISRGSTHFHITIDTEPYGILTNSLEIDKSSDKQAFLLNDTLITRAIDAVFDAHFWSHEHFEIEVDFTKESNIDGILEMRQNNNVKTLEVSNLFNNKFTKLIKIIYMLNNYDLDQFRYDFVYKNLDTNSTILGNNKTIDELLNHTNSMMSGFYRVEFANKIHFLLRNVSETAFTRIVVKNAN